MGAQCSERTREKSSSPRSFMIRVILRAFTDAGQRRCTVFPDIRETLVGQVQGCAIVGRLLEGLGYVLASERDRR